MSQSIITPELTRNSILSEPPKSRKDPDTLFGILPDYAIAHFAQHHEMIRPFFAEQIRNMGENNRKILSKGSTSYGYDVSLSTEVKIFTNVNGCILDPKDLDQQSMTDAAVFTSGDESQYVILPPNSYMLGVTNEYFKIPRDILILCVGKSTMARIGAIVNCTPIEPGFEGNVVIEIANTTTLPMKVYLNEGIAQFIFFRGDAECVVSYADGNRKYQGQTGVTLPRV